MTTQTAVGPVQVAGEVLSVRRAGAFHHLTFVAPGIAERHRPGAQVALSVGGPMSAVLLRRALPVFRTRATGAYGGTVEVVLPATDDAGRWLAGAPAGTALDVVGPVGRPFALPRDPVTCLLVADGAASAPLFGLAERLRERGCVVHMLLTGETEAHVFGALEARRAARTVTVTTADGSVGIPGTPADVLPDLLDRSAADVVYAAGPVPLLHAAARAAEQHGAWSQVAVPWPTACGTGLCHGCAVPVVAEHGVAQLVRACTEGPVLRGDRVRWDALVGDRG
ncbi:MAG: iron-sulfur cluster-binding protein [Nocardioidaceae bacterium]